MNRSFLVLAAGLLAGLAVHFAYFETRRPGDVDSVEGHLAWMREQLQLTDAQYAAIRSLHERSSPRLRELAAHLERVRSQEEAFERGRVAGEPVDFLAFSDLVDERREVGRESQASTQELVGRTTRVLSPEQRRRFLALLPALVQVVPLEAGN